MSKMRFRVQKSPFGDWDVVHVETGRVLVQRESMTVAERVCDAANRHGPCDGESGEVGERMAQWADDCERQSALIRGLR